MLVMPSNDLVYYIQKGRKKTCIERTLHVFFYYRIAGWFDQMLRPMTPTSLNLNGLLSLRGTELHSDSILLLLTRK